KFDSKKLVGKWEPAKPKKGEAMVMEFTKDGKLTVTGEMNGKEVKIEGTYKLDGDKLSFALKFMDIEIKETVTLTKLTDEEMAGKDKDGKEESFKKVKPK
ncbi:MAG TPA: TIGR03066 family protein, partial [Gemmata sp.]